VGQEEEEGVDVLWEVRWERSRKKVRLRRVLDGGLHSGVAGRGGRMTWMAKWKY